ncbi:hypothetical protein TcWFU_009323 [Taenia crassiceps]|uniref:Uncharacterized protein n=1 Tax=Taenia crassiceps TaxID=6207 RepID=A0ABR4QBJ1_9CEST
MNVFFLKQWSHLILTIASFQTPYSIAGCFPSELTLRFPQFSLPLGNTVLQPSQWLSSPSEHSPVQTLVP